MYHYEKTLKASDIVWSVSISAEAWSSMLISVTWVELLWAVYKFFRINNIGLKCSFVRCRKYHKSWWNGAAELHIPGDLLCGTTAAELHNSADLLCGTNDRRNFWKIQQTLEICTLYEDSANFWKMNALRRQNKRRTHESPRELVRQSEARRKQAPQSEANECRWRRQRQSRKNLPY